MPYNRPRYPHQQQQQQQQEPVQQPQSEEKQPGFLSTMWDAARAGAEGFYEGAIGHNLNYQQNQLNKKRKMRGLPPGQYRSRNWLGRLLRGK